HAKPSSETWDKAGCQCYEWETVFHFLLSTRINAGLRRARRLRSANPDPASGAGRSRTKSPVFLQVRAGEGRELAGGAPGCRGREDLANGLEVAPDVTELVSVEQRVGTPAERAQEIVSGAQQFDVHECGRSEQTHDIVGLAHRSEV